MTPRSAPELDELDRRIVAALHLDGRATWRRIALALDQPERTIARRGSQLLEQGHITVRALANPGSIGRGEKYLLQATCEPRSSWSAAAAIARHPETVFTHLLFGAADLVADIWCPEHRVTSLFFRELAAVPGILRTRTSPILRYVTTLHDWDFGLLNEDEAAALSDGPQIDPWAARDAPAVLSRTDKLLVCALSENGRCSYDELGRLCGVSEQTAKRRVDSLQQRGVLAFRAVAEPAVVGLPVGAMVWIRCRPDRVEPVAQELAAARYVRYAAVLIGDDQLVADIRVPDRRRLHELLTSAPWAQQANSLSTSLIAESLEQSDVLSGALHG